MEGVEEPVFSAEQKKETEEIPVYETETGVQLEFETNVDMGLSEEHVQEKLKEALDSQSPKKRKKNTVISLCLLAVNIVFMVFIIKSLIANVGDISIKAMIEAQGKKLWWIAGGVLIYVVYMLAQTLMYLVLIKDLTGKRRVKLAYDVAVVGKYYDNITPFAVGGQPMQIVRLATNGISPGVSTSIPIIKMMINSAVNMVAALMFFIFGLPRIPLTSPFNDLLLIILEILGVIGLIITVFVVFFMFLVSTGNFVTRTFVSAFVRIGYKLKIVKNYRLTVKKVMGQVAEYKSSMHYLRKRKLVLLKMIILSLVECLSYAIMPYFVVMAFAGPLDMSPFLFIVICLTKYYICSMASSFIPLPGGTGLMEISFIFLFGIVVNENIVWALLLYRFISYYLIIIHGFGHELIKIGKNIYKNRQKKETA